MPARVTAFFANGNQRRVGVILSEAKNLGRNEEKRKSVRERKAADSPTPEDAEPWRWCPRCGHELVNHRCKFVCPRCRYFLSWSDFD